VYTAIGHGELKAGDDAARAEIFRPESLPGLAFDHGQILADYFQQHPFPAKK
jgi:8-oxo-dGTP diphosphatase